MTFLLSELLHPRPALRGLALLLLAGSVGALLLAGAQPWAPNFIPAPPIDKLLHMFAYGSFAAMSWILFGGSSFVAPVLLAVLVGVADEWLQSFTTFRSPSVRDLAADLAGALLSVSLLALMRLRVRPARDRRIPGTR